MTRDEKITLVSSHCEVGRWKCTGAGEISATVYINGVAVFELFGDNGSNRLYNPSGEVWTESVDEVLNRMSDEALDDLVRIVEEGPRFLRCEICGDVLAVLDERYEDENPNASSAWYSQLIDEHYEKYHNDASSSEETPLTTNDTAVKGPIVHPRRRKRGGQTTNV